MNGRPTFTESHPTVFADTSGEGRGSATLRVPSTFNASPGRARPLVLLVSSRNNAITTLETDWSLTNFATEMDALVLLVQGKTGTSGANSWNANECCCWRDADGAQPDDSAYLASLPAKLIAAGYNVDLDRVYGLGQGGAGDSVLYRSACDHADTYAAIVGFAGSGPISVEGGEAACSPTSRVAFAHVHGTSDASQELYTGSPGLNAGMANHCVSTIDANGTMDQLKAFNGCTGTLAVQASSWADLSDVAGTETDRLTYTSCPAGGDVELWRMNSEDHTLAPTSTFRTKVIEFFNAHVKQ